MMTASVLTKEVVVDISRNLSNNEQRKAFLALNDCSSISEMQEKLRHIRAMSIEDEQIVYYLSKVYEVLGD